MAGKQVRLFLADGTAGGIMTAEIGNWTGHVLTGKRIDLSTLRRRDEASRTGIYILLGTADDGERLAYIGQSDDISARLVNHDAAKDFWDEAVIITSKDANLTSAHVRYLESRLVRIAQSIGRVTLTNTQRPTGGAALPEADASDMEYFIDQIRILMPVLGHDLFRGRGDGGAALTSPAPTAAGSPALPPVDSPTFHLRTRTGVDASAQVVDGEFTVLRGSLVSSLMSRSAQQSENTEQMFHRRTLQHTELMRAAEPGPDGRTVRLTKDVPFTSPSAAAATVIGRASANGRREWVSGDGQTYGAWEDSRAQA